MEELSVTTGGSDENIDQNDVNISFENTGQVSSPLTAEQKKHLIQRTLELLEPIEWEIDLRALKDLKRCSDDVNSICFLQDIGETVSLRSIIETIGQQLVTNQIISEEEVKSFYHNSLNTNSGTILPKRWIEIDNFLVLGFSSYTLTQYYHVFYRLNEATDLGLEDLTSFVLIIIGPSQVKANKSVEKVSRTFAAALHDSQLQHDLLHCTKSEDVSSAISSFLQKATLSTSVPALPTVGQVIPSRVGPILFGSLYNDIKKRLPLYWSDWRDGICSAQAIGRTVATVLFLYFACILPAIAFGAHNEHNTNGRVTVAKTILAQGAGGIIFSLLAGQPMVVLINTAPLAIYIQLTYEISTKNNFDFWGFYALIGLFNAAFLIIFSITGVSSLLKYSSRFVEEIFALFIAVAFIYDGGKPLVNELINKIYSCDMDCDPTSPLLMIIFAFVTLWICYKLSIFRESVYFKSSIRQTISNYALPLGVLLASGLRHAIFFPLDIPEFTGDKENIISLASFHTIPIWGYFVAMGLGFLLSLLFFVDQNISAALANALDHNLKKYSGYHLDLFVVGLINIVLSILGLPWIHGGLPHSALHVRMLGTIQKVFHQGHIEEKFIKVQETRVTGFLSHTLLVCSLFLLPTPLRFIPLPVLYGVFWYLGVSSLIGNQFWNRIVLIFTDQRLYPPSVNDRQILQKYIHFFTAIQILCFIVFCVVSFYPNPYLTAVFPVIIVLLIPLRHFVLPRIIPKRALALLDGY